MTDVNENHRVHNHTFMVTCSGVVALDLSYVVTRLSYPTATDSRIIYSYYDAGTDKNNNRVGFIEDNS